jgi:hypothetical protein
LQDNVLNGIQDNGIGKLACSEMNFLHLYPEITNTHQLFGSAANWDYKTNLFRREGCLHCLDRWDKIAIA